MRRALPLALVLAGIAAAGGAALPELLGGGTPGFGTMQLLLAAAGVALVFAGTAARTTDGWRRIAAWWEAPVATRAAELGRYAVILAQLAMLLLLFRHFEIENQAFWGGVAVLGFGGFALHYFLPATHRLTFFVLLCLAGIYSVLGLVNGAWVVTLGAGLIGVCYLPLPFAARMALLLAAGALLALLRVEWLPAPWGAAVWPIVASLFMFRLIAYAYDLRHARERPGVARSLAYFFLLPNVLFPLFPVVDFTTFTRTYYDADEFAIYQRGVRWMFRGVVQLVFYRLVYQHLTLAPNEVAAPADLARFLVANILLYVRVSGQFHLIVGLLHLFGFHLPLTNNRYFLAPNFSEYWRRINVYWKDFMMKVVFYPAYFALRRHGEKAALVLGTFLVIGATWALHSYQWFWLLGRFPVTPTDLVFWGALAVLLAVNTLYETRSGKKRAAVPRPWGVAAALTALQTGVTFTVICVLWSLWTSASLGDWLGLWDAVRVSPVLGLGGVLGTLVGGMAVIAFAALLLERAAGPERAAREPTPRRSLAWSAGTFAVLYGALSPAVTERFDARTRDIVASLHTAELNQQDAALVQRGYYEQLNGVSRVNSQLWEVYAKRPVTWPVIWQTAAGRRVDSYLYVELVPSQRISFGGATLTTNRWGLRDHEYERAKPLRTFRMAVVGASTTMGWRVGDDETFESIVEQRLNRDAMRLAGFERIESLNFSVPGYETMMYGALVDRALGFQPDAVLLFIQDNDLERTIGRLAGYAMDGTPFPDDTVRAMALEAAQGAPSKPVVERRLKPRGEVILARYYRAIAERCRAQGARPVWVYLPGLEHTSYNADRDVLFRAARLAGFTIVDLSDLYRGRDKAALTVEDADFHPNAQGHRVIARRLYDAVAGTPEIFAPVARQNP